MLEECPALTREAEPTRVVPIKQPQAGYVLQFFQSLRYRWLGHIQHASRLRDSAGLGDTSKIGELLERESNHIFPILFARYLDFYFGQSRTILASRILTHGRLAAAGPPQMDR
jgi:hypothetical protein